MQRQNITVALAGTDPAALAACSRALLQDENISIVAQAGGMGGVPVGALHVGPRILLLDLDLCDDADCTLLSMLRAKFPCTRVVLLVHRDVEESRLLIALAMGARGYLEYETVERYLAKAVRSVNQGETWVPRKVLSKMMDTLLH